MGHGKMVKRERAPGNVKTVKWLCLRVDMENGKFGTWYAGKKWQKFQNVEIEE